MDPKPTTPPTDRVTLEQRADEVVRVEGVNRQYLIVGDTPGAWLPNRPENVAAFLRALYIAAVEDAVRLAREPRADGAGPATPAWTEADVEAIAVAWNRHHRNNGPTEPHDREAVRQVLRGNRCGYSSEFIAFVLARWPQSPAPEPRRCACGASLNLKGQTACADCIDRRQAAPAPEPAPAPSTPRAGEVDARAEAIRLYPRLCAGDHAPPACGPHCIACGDARLEAMQVQMAAMGKDEARAKQDAFLARVARDEALARAEKAERALEIEQAARAKAEITSEAHAAALDCRTRGGEKCGTCAACVRATRATRDAELEKARADLDAAKVPTEHAGRSLGVAERVRLLAHDRDARIETGSEQIANNNAMYRDLVAIAEAVGLVGGWHVDGAPLARIKQLQAALATATGERERAVEIINDRVEELAVRLVAAGPKAAHVSASETHEISDAICAVRALLSPPAAPTDSPATNGEE